MRGARLLSCALLWALSASSCHKRGPSPQSSAQAEQREPRVTEGRANPVAPQLKASARARLTGALSSAAMERLSEELSEISEERARVQALSERLSQADLSVPQLAELLELFDLEVARLEAIERLGPRLIEGDGEGERHALLDLFEDPSNRARAVDLLGWH